MQKLINVLALASFAVSAAVVGAGAYVYVNKDALLKELLPIPDLDMDLPVPGAELPADVAPIPTIPSF